MLITKLCSALLVTGLALTTSGCSSPSTPTGPAGESSTKATEGGTIRIGLIGLMSDAGVAIALERGYFEKRGVVLEIQDFPSGGGMVAPMAAGDLDVGGGAYSAGMVNAVTSGNPLIIVADKGSFPTPELGSQQFVVRADLADEIQEFSDLKGRKIAVGTAVGTASYSEIFMLLEEAGNSDPESLILSMKSSDVVVALDQGAVEAAWLSEPNAALAIQKGYAVPWKVAYDVAPKAQDSTIFFNGDWAKDNPELAQSFMDAYVCGVNDFIGAMDDPTTKDEVLQILADYTGISMDVVKEAQPPGFFENAVPDTESIEDILKNFVALGQVEKTVPVDQLVDLQYVNAAIGADCG